MKSWHSWKKPEITTQCRTVDARGVAKKTGARISGYRCPATEREVKNQTSGEGAADCPRLVQRRSKTSTTRLPYAADCTD